MGVRHDTEFMTIARRTNQAFGTWIALWGWLRRLGYTLMFYILFFIFLYELAARCSWYHLLHPWVDLEDPSLVFIFYFWLTGSCAAWMQACILLCLLLIAISHTLGLCWVCSLELASESGGWWVCGWQAGFWSLLGIDTVVRECIYDALLLSLCVRHVLFGWVTFLWEYTIFYNSQIDTTLSATIWYCYFLLTSHPLS